MQKNPILANVVRGSEIESTHSGSVLAVNDKGETLFALGNVGRMIFPRSAIKFFQAIPLVESGAADRFGLNDKDIALACASHNAEDFHALAVENWLTRLGLTIDDLECGPAPPSYRPAARAMLARGEAPTKAHQNCSGKHSGMLTMAKFLDAETTGYSDYRHPSQQTWMQTYGELIDCDLGQMHWERDGCGLPALCMPMDKVAYGFARYANIENVEGTRGAAMQRILGAVRAHPEMIAGTERCCTNVIEKTQGEVLVKTGAEGVYGGCIPKLGVGFAIKIDDGATRGSEVALGALLKKLGAIDAPTLASLTKWFQPEVRNSQKWRTGEVVASSVWE